MDQPTRNELRKAVTECRRLLEEAVAQVLQGQFGIYPTGKEGVHVEDVARMGHLSAEDRAYRADLLAHLDHIQALGYRPKDALGQLVREIAFTHLNRLAAYKMMEAREVWVGGQRFREAVGRGMKSQGFQFYLAEHPEDERLFNTGQQDVAYRHFLDWLGGRLSGEIGVLFSPTDPANRLYPPQRVLDEVLTLLNAEELKGIWAEDEAIGWVYQYFTPKELRDQARKESQAPRNGYELAFRNQFFTPRYVVDFLTDNTLGRVWYEMRKGETRLRDQCRFMVRRPVEVFLKDGVAPPVKADGGQNDLSQGELLLRPVHVPHRPKQDPRELKCLDPACGSGHFLLYCFDLLLTIYEEAYDDPDLGPALKRDYPSVAELRKATPGLILAHNLHGIDIDLRASQIAALALWLRCQRAYKDMGLKQDRPAITRSNLVCAEPMPGEDDLLEEFLAELRPPLLGQLVKVVFDRMKLAGEAGSLLKIEEEIRDTVAEAKRQWLAGPVSVQRTLFDEGEETAPRQMRFDFSGLTDEQFWQQAETRVVEALRAYAGRAANGGSYRRRLFVNDAERGFAFVDLCEKKFAVVLMNPPFGEPSKPSKELLDGAYPRTKNDVYAAFVERGLGLLHPGGMLGAITSRTGFFLSSFQRWREEILLQETTPAVVADLGSGVLDTAMVETAAYCLRLGQPVQPATFYRLLGRSDPSTGLAEVVHRSRMGESSPLEFIVDPGWFRRLPASPFAYWISSRIRALFSDLPPFENESENRTTRCGLGTTDNFRFLRLRWEVSERRSTRDWPTYYDGGVFSPMYDTFPLVVDWKDDGKEIKAFIAAKFGSASRNVRGEDRYFLPGFVFPRRTKGLSPKVLARGGIFSNAGQAGFAPEGELLWTMSLLSSRLASFLVSLSQGRTGDAAQFEVGLIKRLPWVRAPKGQLCGALAACASRIIEAKQQQSRGDETAPVFVMPHVRPCETGCLRTQVGRVREVINSLDRQVAEAQSEVDELSLQVYSLTTNDLTPMPEEAPSDGEDGEGAGGDEVDGVDLVEAKKGAADLTADSLSYAVGCGLGRWDIRYPLGQRQARFDPDPFAPLPLCPPGMLQGMDGFPLAATPEGYPLRITWEGMLVDDPDHTEDIIRRVREVLELVWKDRAEAIEQEACEILGVKELRDYFRKPGAGGFWADHVARYSKSRRKAPIYWLLQSGRKNYALWLYYHRLDKDILFKALVNYVEPKIRLEDGRLGPLREQRTALGAGGRGAKKIDRDIEKQENLVSELQDFADKLRRAANMHLVPDLNDGVVLNIAPLWELVPWKEAKTYWDELLSGQYEWSSIGKQLRQKGLVQT